MNSLPASLEHTRSPLPLSPAPPLTISLPRVVLRVRLGRLVSLRVAQEGRTARQVDSKLPKLRRPKTPSQGHGSGKRRV